MSLSAAAELVARASSAEVLLRLVAPLTDAEVLALLHDPLFWSRPEQRPPPGEWDIWVFTGGRGTGKTFAGGNFANEMAETTKLPGILVGATAKDVRDTMILGPSGVMETAKPWFRPKYEPSKSRLTWPNGAFAICYSADKPDRLRGPNAAWGWGDEITSWSHEMAAFDQMRLVLRIGRRPRMLLTTTPKPMKKFQEVLKLPGTVLTRGTTFDNAANLAESSIAQYREYANTRWGRQELLGELLMDVEGAIFARAKWQRRDQLTTEDARREYERRIVSVDPSPTSDVKSDESGIVVEGLRHVGDKKRIGVLADLTMKGTPREWACAAITAYQDWGCDALVVEVNSGGEMVEEVVSTVAAEMEREAQAEGRPWSYVHVVTVRATSAKAGRGQPVSALAELGQVEFCGEFPKLEKQLSLFTGVNGRRDDAADAFCWGVHELALGNDFFVFV